MWYKKEIKSVIEGLEIEEKKIEKKEKQDKNCRRKREN